MVVHCTTADLGFVLVIHKVVEVSPKRPLQTQIVIECNQSRGRCPQSRVEKHMPKTPIVVALPWFVWWSRSVWKPARQFDCACHCLHQLVIFCRVSPTREGL